MESGLCMFNDHMQMDLRAGVTTIMMLFWSAVLGVVCLSVLCLSTGVVESVCRGQFFSVSRIHKYLNPLQLESTTSNFFLC